LRCEIDTFCAAPSGLCIVFYFENPWLTPGAILLSPLRGWSLDMAPAQLMHAIDTQLAHVWMVRAFIKHSEEAAEDEELAQVHRELYDFMLALGGPFKEGNADEYLKLAKKKFGKLKKATESFEKI